MSERAPTPPPFDPVPVSEALHTAGQPTTDLAFGPGQRYDLPNGQFILKVFPERPLTRITTHAARVELFGTPPPQVVNDQVVIKREAAQEDATLTVNPDGTVVFGYGHRPTAPAAAGASPEKPVTAPEPAQEPHQQHERVMVMDGFDAAANTTPPATLRPPISIGRSPEATGSPPDTPLSAAPEAAPASGRCTADRQTTQQQPRVQLTGRLGRDPSFRTSPYGTLVVRFPLAVHQRGGTTTWHSILAFAFGDRARQLQHRSESGELAKGQEVSLVGYPHTREQPTREGTKTVTEIYAVAVTRR